MKISDMILLALDKAGEEGRPITPFQFDYYIGQMVKAGYLEHNMTSIKLTDKGREKVKQIKGDKA
jgi:predicted transcriptional regulator